MRLSIALRVCALRILQDLTVLSRRAATKTQSYTIAPVFFRSDAVPTKYHLPWSAKQQKRDLISQYLARTEVASMMTDDTLLQLCKLQLNRRCTSCIQSDCPDHPKPPNPARLKQRRGTSRTRTTRHLEACSYRPSTLLYASSVHITRADSLFRTKNVLCTKGLPSLILNHGKSPNWA